MQTLRGSRARRTLSLLLLSAPLLVVCGVVLYRQTRSTPSPPLPQAESAASPEPLRALTEEFSEPALDPGRWSLTSEGDFREKAIDVQGGRLRLRAGTIGTDDRTVKFLGVRTTAPLRVGRETRVAADFDWNRQANGCYLSGALILAPAATAGNPLAGPDWLCVEYVGVPPGKNGRILVSSRTAGRERHLFKEGWPEENREGRPLSVQKVEIVLKAGAFELLENGRKIFECAEPVVRFAGAHLYLQMSSHSNYPPRELFFDNIHWTAID